MVKIQAAEATFLKPYTSSLCQVLFLKFVVSNQSQDNLDDIIWVGLSL